MQRQLDVRPKIPPRIVDPGPEPLDDEIDLFAVVRTLWRGKVVIIACMLIVMLIAGYYAFMVAVPTYRATAQMALQLRQENVVDFESVLSGVSSDQASINTEMEVIRSRALITQLVAQLALHEDPEFNRFLRPTEVLSFGIIKAWIRGWIPGQAPATGPAPTQDDQLINVVDNVRDAISTSIGRQSYVFTIAAVTQSPAKSALIANALAALYRDDQIAVKVEATENAAIWLSDRVSELQMELEAQQAEINELRTRNALISVEALAALNTQAVETAAALEVAEVAFARSEAQVVAMEAVPVDNLPERAEAAGDAQLQALALAAARGDDTARTRFDRRFEQVLLQTTGERDRARIVATELQAQSVRIAAQYDGQSSQLSAIQQLERETEATRVLYETFLNRLKETTVQVGVHQADSRILSAATPGQLVAPRKTRIIALAMIIGLILGAGLTLLREMMQNTYRTAADLERQTGVTVVGQIPRIPARARSDTIAYLANKPTSAAAEAIRNLRTSVLLSNIDNPPKVIVSTSSIPGEGKTTLAIALAQNLAGLQKRVILIEGDIRRRTFTNYFPLAKGQPGILSVIARRVPLADSVWRDPILGIDVLMGEKSSINAADVFSSDSFQTLLQDMRASYDYIIIDTPPVLVVPDARVIAPLADAVVYVVNWDSTTKTQVAEGIKQLRSVNVHVTGLVLSQINARQMRRYGYGTYYGAYSRYASGYYDG